MNINWNIELKSELLDLEFFFILNLSGFIVKQNNFYLELLKPAFEILTKNFISTNKEELLEKYYLIAASGHNIEKRYLSLSELLKFFFNG